MEKITVELPFENGLKLIVELDKAERELVEPLLKGVLLGAIKIWAYEFGKKLGEEPSNPTEGVIKIHKTRKS